MTKAQIHISLKPGVLDVQGKAVAGALKDLGFDGVAGVRVGKLIEVEVAETDAAKAEAAIKDMCEKLLANTVIEKYSVELV